MNTRNSTFKQLFEQELSLATNAVCHDCDAQLKQPLMPWHVGRKFLDSPERLVFVGKPHRGTPGIILPSGIVDPEQFVRNGLWDVTWPYWRYTREIAEKLYGQDAFDSIAMTNLIKCTSVLPKKSTRDQTTLLMAECCILRLGVIWRELQLLQPKSIIFYTYGLYRQIIDRLPIAIAGSIREVTSQNHRVRCGNKQLGWWERECKTPWASKVRVLVVGHPERMRRVDYVSLLTKWARQ